jgi:hypothetical protein
MIRKELEKIVGPVTEMEWKRVCQIAGADIRVNRLVWRQKTSRRYLQMVLTAAIQIIRS